MNELSRTDVINLSLRELGIGGNPRDDEKSRVEETKPSVDTTRLKFDILFLAHIAVHWLAMSLYFDNLYCFEL